MGKKWVVFSIIFILGMLKVSPVFALYDGYSTESEKAAAQAQVVKTETLSGRYLVCDETGSSINDVSVSLLKPEGVFSAGDKGKKTAFVIADSSCKMIGGVGYVSLSYCLSKKESKFFDCEIVTSKITGCASVGIEKKDCKEKKIALYYAGNAVGLNGKYYSTTKETPLMLEMINSSTEYNIRIPVVENSADGFVEDDFGWECVGCDKNLQFFHVANEPTVATIKVTGGPVLGVKTLTINTNQKGIPSSTLSVMPSSEWSNSFTFYVKLFANCPERLKGKVSCEDDTNQEICKKLCAPDGDADYCYYMSRNRCVDKANVEITPQDRVNYYSETNYPKPDGYTGPLPDCAFSGTCRKVNQLVNLVIDIANWVFGIMGSVAFLFFVAGGFMMIFSMGNPDHVKQGKNILVYAIIGMAISLSAYVLVDFLLDSLGVENIFRVVK